MKVGIFDHLSLRLGGAQLVVACMAERLAKSHTVEIIHSGKGYNLAGLGEAFCIDLKNVNERIVECSLQSFVLPGLTSLVKCPTQIRRNNRDLTSPYDLFIYSGHGVPPFCYSRWGLIYNHFPFESMPSRNTELSEKLRDKNRIVSRIRLKVHDALFTRRLSGYQGILANSHFTAGWIRQLWGRTATVLYPPVSLQPVVLPKENLIVSLGRFICTDTKGHAQQLNAFRIFLKRYPDWKLCLIGFCTDLAPDRKYLAELRKQAENLPVIFEVNATRQVVAQRLGQAKLYWHTTGLSDDKDLPPSATEHFGISTVEAMRSGCVPLVPSRGGQTEIVEPEVSGYHCRDLEDLVIRSMSILGEDARYDEMSKMARDHSNRFLPEVFGCSLYSAVHQVTSGHGLNAYSADPAAATNEGASHL